VAQSPATARPTARLQVTPVEAAFSFRNQAYRQLKAAIIGMDLYGHKEEVRLDERQLSHDLGVSRTPIREALTLLEQEGFVRTVPRRGIYVARKTKREIVEMITVWAALEGMAARFITERASDAEIASLRVLFKNFEREAPESHLDEYSNANLAFHQAIIRMSGCTLIDEIAENLFFHIRAIRRMTIGQDHRAERSIVDHMNIIAALESRDTELAERLARQHTLDLATHVDRHCTYLD
jgi:DNA-binding GntR family transcriptional regulator